jgi:hypothetical protein
MPEKGDPMDRRTQSRTPTAKAARLVPPQGGRVLPCRVLNVSKTGARLETLEPVDVHRKFILHLEEGGATHRCQVVWQKGHEIGVTFE